MYNKTYVLVLLSLRGARKWCLNAREASTIKKKYTFKQICRLLSIYNRAINANPLYSIDLIEVKCSIYRYDLYYNRTTLKIFPSYFLSIQKNGQNHILLLIIIIY